MNSDSAAPPEAVDVVHDPLPPHPPNAAWSKLGGETPNSLSDDMVISTPQLS